MNNDKELADKVEAVDDARLLRIRIEQLEARLELYPVNGKGEKQIDLKLDIGTCDGIGCRDETIYQLDKRIEQLEKVLDCWRKAAVLTDTPLMQETCKVLHLIDLTGVGHG